MRMQTGITDWNNSRMDSFTLMRILPRCKQLNTFLKVYIISIASGQTSGCVRRGGWCELLPCIQKALCSQAVYSGATRLP